MLSAARSFFFFLASASAQHSTNASAASATRLLIIIEKFFGESMVTCTEYKFGEAQLLAGPLLCTVLETRFPSLLQLNTQP